MVSGMHPLFPLTLVGDQVRLEPLDLRHLDGLLDASAESRSSYGWTYVPADRSAMKAWIAEALADAEAGRAVPFATVDASGGRIIGATRFANLERWHWRGPPVEPRPVGPDAVEIGWTWLAHGAQRTATNSEAKLLMLRHAFAVWRVYRVTLKTDARNQRSRSAIERIGGRLDGIMRAHMPGADHTVRDTACYSLVRAEWPEVERRLAERLARAPSRR